MTWIPAFKIGVLNAWILLIYYPLHPLILILVDKAIGKGDIFKKMGGSADDPGDKRSYMMYMVILIALLAYSIFLPLRLNTVWFYTGIVIYTLGLLAFLISIVNVAKAPLGQIFTQGMYRYSRHPLYLSALMTFLGVGIACASWLFLLMTVTMMVIQAYQVKAEEQECLSAFGDEYGKYMDQTPRWIGIAKTK